MLEENNQNGFLTDDNDLDLGSDLGSGDFADFVSIDDDLDGIFDDAPKSEPTTPEAIPKPEPTIPEAAPKQESEEQNAPVDLPQEAESPEPKATPEPTDAGKGKKESLEEAGNAEKTDVPKATVSAKAENEADGGESADVPNVFEAAIAKAEEKQADALKRSLMEKLPIFSYAKAEEEIADPSETFDQLRNEKAEDFPELDDGTSVSWKMVYGTITKSVSTPKKTTIESLKKQIEDSKEFSTMLKKAKGDVKCQVTPSVTAKRKGIISSYKGIYTSLDEAERSGKTITFIPSDNGKVYEVRFNKIGTFRAEADTVSMASKVRAGFTPALPKIPYAILSQIIAFFKSFVTRDRKLEAIANIYWSFLDSKYYVHVPKQKVSATSVDTSLPEIDEEKFPLIMEVHSHNTMEAIFSSTDNKDERATRLYAVIGKLDKVFPDITVRISVGGKFVEIPPETVFEGIAGEYPDNWREAVEMKTPLQKEDM